MTVKNFAKDCKRLLDTYPHIHKIPGWDTLAKKQVETTITFSLPDMSFLDIQVEVVDLTISPTPLGDGYTLAADVLANSLYYLFRTREQSHRYKLLNAPSAIKSHPLAHNLAAFYNWGNGDIIGDCLYRHPKNPEEGE